MKNCKIHVYKANNIQLTNKTSCIFTFTGSSSFMPGFGHVINLNLIQGKGHQSECSHCHILDNISCMKRANIINVHLHMIVRRKGEKMSIINNEQY